jgi:hypothetical protein
MLSALMAAIQSGELKVEGMENMMAFGLLFPTPTFDTVIEPISQEQGDKR